MWGTMWPCTLLCCGTSRLEASVSQGGRGNKGIPGTDWFRPGRGCGQEILSSVPCPMAVRIRDITNVYVTANAHGFTRNAHQEPKPMPILDRRTKKLNSGLWPWLRFSLMHMEARECVEGLRGTANLTGSTPGITHCPAGHMVLQSLSWPSPRVHPGVASISQENC